MPIQLKSKTSGVANNLAPADAGPVSLRPSDQVSEGLLDDVDVTFSDWCFTLEGPPNYNTGDNVPLFVKATLTDGEGVASDQWWSSGDSSKFQPSEDGSFAVRVKGSGGLGNSTNAAALFASLVDAGFPEDKMSGRVTDFNGLVAHVRRVPQKKRGNLPQQEGRGPSTVLVVEKILKMPWEKAGKAPAKTATTKLSQPAPVPASQPESSNGDAGELAAEVLTSILEQTNPVKKSQIPMKALKLLSTEKYKPYRVEILNQLKSDEFLSAVAELDEAGNVSA